MDEELRTQIAQLIYGDGEELPWPRSLQIADTILWELNWNKTTHHQKQQ